MMLEAIAHNNSSKDLKKLPNLSYNMKAGGLEKVWIAFESKRNLS